MSLLGLSSIPPLTVEETKKKFPSKKHTITDETVDLLNEVITNPDFDGRAFLGHLVDYQGCMIDSGGSLIEYINAMKFCAYLEQSQNLVQAYKKARISDEFVASRINAPTDTPAYTELASAASRYRKSKLVRQILTQSDLPLYLMFQSDRYKAVAVLAREMQHAELSRDRIAAAKELLVAVKAPENMQIELAVGPNRAAKDLQQDLNTQLAKLAANQQALLMAGLDIREVQKTGISLNDTQDAELDDE